MMRYRLPLLLLLLGACLAHGAELARLTNGFEMRCKRHEERGGVTRLYLDSEGAGFVDVPTESIASYEPVPDLPQPAVKTTVPEHIARAGLATGIDPDFIHSVIKAESGYQINAVSPKGAQGLMQLMPGTAARLGVHDSFDPANNIDGGSRYLRELLLRYNGDAIKALAAYNAGPESVEKYKGVPPYRETRNYVARVINDFNRRKLCPDESKEGVCRPLAPSTASGPKQAAVREKKDVSRSPRTEQRKSTARRRATTTNASRQLPNSSTGKGEESVPAVPPLSARNQN